MGSRLSERRTNGDERAGDVNVVQHQVGGEATGVSTGPIYAKTVQFVSNFIEPRPRGEVDELAYARRLLEPHASRLARMRGFAEYLGSARLPFVAPRFDDPSHPRNVWREIAGASPGGGVLLCGVGGVGKTRCALEVAKLADTSGWNVVWMRQMELMPELGMVERALDALVGGLEGKDTLLVLDYVDQMVGLNLDLVSNHFRTFDRPVRLLATSRPLRSDDLVRRAPVQVVTVDLQKEQRAELVRLMLRRAAPRALTRLGEPLMVEICGDRPIIALLIARLVEEREVNGELGEEFLVRARTRGRDLFVWLDRRVNAFVRSLEELFDDEPKIRTKLERLMASVLGMCPIAEPELREGAYRVVRRLGMRESDADDLITLLHESGWLEGTRGHELWVVHDVVADQAMQAALDQRRESARQEAFADVMDSAFSGARALGRLSTSVSRTLISGEEQVHQRLDAVVRYWWEASVDQLAGAMVTFDHDSAGYTLGALLKREPWQELLWRSWNRLLGPWVAHYGLKPGARHVFYLGLRHVREHAGRLLSAAARWLEVNRERVDASFVLRPLLGHPELDIEEARRVVGYSIEWLSRFGEEESACYVLNGLLSLHDLEDEVELDIIDRAISWLHSHASSSAYTRLLGPLLSRRSLQGERERVVTSLGIAWVREHSLDLNCCYALSRLMERCSEEQVDGVTDLALGWLRVHHTAERSARLIKAVLGRPGMRREVAAMVRPLAHAWLHEHHRHPAASYVLSALLDCREGNDEIEHELAERLARELEQYTLRWLDEHSLTEGADVILRLSLDADFPTRASASAIKEHALAWLRRHRLHEKASFVLKSLLKLPRLGDSEPEATEHAFAWLQEFGTTENAVFVLRGVLGLRRLPPELTSEVIERSVTWLEAHGGNEDASFLLKELVVLVNEDELGYKVSKIALAWLSQYATTKNAGYVLKALLRERGERVVGMSSGVSRWVIRHAFDWIAAHNEQPFGDLVIKALLSWRWPDDDSASLIAGHTLVWLRRNCTKMHAKYTIQEMLSCKQFDENTKAEAVPHALAWLDEHGSDEGAEQLLVNLLRLSGLESDRMRSVMDYTFRWLEDSWGEERCRSVLRRLVERRGDEPELVRRKLECALRWLHDFHTDALARTILKTLLSLDELNEQTYSKVVQYAVDWLRLRTIDSGAIPIVRHLLEVPELDEACTAEVIARALALLRAENTRELAVGFLDVLLAHPRLDRESRDEAVQLALVFLREGQNGEQAEAVLEHLHARSDLEPSVRAEVGGYAVVLAQVRDERLSVRSEVEAGLDSGAPIEGVITGRVTSGFSVVLRDAIPAFLPTAHAPIRSVRKPEELIGRRTTFRVLKIDESRRVVVSHREVVSREALEGIVPGMEIDGTVISVLEFGAFVDIGGLNGLLHKSKIRHLRSSRDSRVGLSVGDKVRVVVVKAHELGGKPRVELDLRHVEGPRNEGAQETEKMYPNLQPGTEVDGIVRNVVDFGVFVDVGGINGLLHASRMTSLLSGRSPTAVVAKGDRMKVVVLRRDDSGRKPRFHLAVPDDERKSEVHRRALERIAVGSTVEGVVENVLDYGAFIDLGGVTGLLHKSRIPACSSGAPPQQILRRGDSVTVEVLGIQDTAKGPRIDLDIVESET